MAHTMEKPRDVAGGLLIVAIGAGFLLFGWELPVGSSLRMGAGYFPAILSWLMIALGAAIAGLAWRAPHQEDAFGQVPWRGVLLVIGAVLFFGLTLRGIGLAPAILLVVVATAWASRHASLKASVPLALGLTLFCSLLFIRGLGLPLPLLGPWLSPAPWSAPEPAPAGEAPASPSPAR